MITFKYLKIERPIIENNSVLYDLIIEHPSLLYKFVSDLIDGNEETLLFYDDNCNYDLKDMYLIISDPFTIDPNIKKYINTIYKNSDKKYLNDERKIFYLNIKRELDLLFNEISRDFNTPVRYNANVSLADLMDIADFKIETNFGSMSRRLISFLKGIQEIYKIKFVFIVGFLDMIKEEEMDAFLKEISFLDLTLVNITSRTNNNKKDGIITYIIDKDLCEI